MSPTKVVKSGTCETFHLDLGHEMIKSHLKWKRLVQFFIFIVGINLEDTLARKFDTHDNRYDLSFYLFDFEFVSGVGEYLAFPWISLHLRRMDRVIWGGERFENTLSKKLRKKCSNEHQTLW